MRPDAMGRTALAVLPGPLTIPPVLVGLGIYAGAWSTAAVRTRRMWMAAQGLGALCIAGLTVTLLGTPEQYLFYAIGLGAFAFAPGVFMILSDKA